MHWHATGMEARGGLFFGVDEMVAAEAFYKAVAPQSELVCPASDYEQHRDWEHDRCRESLSHTGEPGKNAAHIGVTPCVDLCWEERDERVDYYENRTHLPRGPRARSGRPRSE